MNNSVNPNKNLSEKPKIFLLKKLNPKITYPLIMIFGLIAIGISGYLVYQEKYKKVTTVKTKTEKTTLTIESEPAGVSMTGGSECDSSKVNKTTPYDCEVLEDQKEIVIVAPSGVDKNNRIYQFKHWEGCSESNEDWRICRVLFEKGKNKKIKANYIINENISSLEELNTNNNGSSGDNQKNQSPSICKNFIFTESPITVSSFKELKSAVVGEWHGCVTTPWVPSYDIKIKLNSDGSYSATSQEYNAMYYGTEKDSPYKKYHIEDFQDNGTGIGTIDIVFDPNSTSGPAGIGVLRNIKVMGKKLYFEFFHRNQYGPLKFQLIKN